MMKVSTRLFAAGVLATTLVAFNTGAFAHDHVPATADKDAACCMMKAGAAKTSAKATAKGKLASADKDCACCKKPSAKATKATVKSSAKAAVKKS